MNKMDVISLRLAPGQLLKEELDGLAEKYSLQAACVLTCVGSLTTAVLRYANQPESTTLTGHFEIVSLMGTFSIHGSHYHIAISDEKGRTYGAHLMEGCRVYTTAEIIVGVLDGVQFLREMDPRSGYPELTIK